MTFEEFTKRSDILKRERGRLLPYTSEPSERGMNAQSRITQIADELAVLEAKWSDQLQANARLSELIGRIKHCLGEIRGVLSPSSQVWAIGHCNQIEKDLEEIRALVCSEQAGRSKG